MEEPGDKNPEDNNPAAGYDKKSGYGKKPLWFWIVLYLVIGLIAYALIYYFFFSGNGSPISY